MQNTRCLTLAKKKQDMRLKKHFWSIVALTTILCTSASAQIIQPESSQICGPAIPTDQAMVLDLRTFGGRDIGAQRAFVKKHAGNYVPAHKDLLIVLVPQPVGASDVDPSLRQSQIEAAKNGCDLVLVYQSEMMGASNTSGWFGTAEVQFATRTR